MNLNFGIPLKRQPKQEKYDFPVLTMQKEPEIKKGARRFLLNKAAFDLLELNPDKTINETLSIGFPQNNNGNFVIAVTTNDNIPDKFKYMIHKSENSFSDSKLYNAIQSELSLDNTNDVEFILNKNENGIISFNLLTEEENKPLIENNINKNGVYNTNIIEDETQVSFDKNSKEEEILTLEVEEENALTLN